MNNQRNLFLFLIKFFRFAVIYFQKLNKFNSKNISFSMHITSYTNYKIYNVVNFTYQILIKKNQNQKIFFFTSSVLFYLLHSKLSLLTEKTQKMLQQKDQSRLQSLFNQRLLQIKRDGIIVGLYHKHQIQMAYVQCSLRDVGKLETLLACQVTLELCTIDGQPLIKIPRKQYLIKKNRFQDKLRVYLVNKSLYKRFLEGPNYILVQNNATIGVLSTILKNRLEGGRYFQKIQNFMGDQDCKQINLDQELILQYSRQNDLNQEQNLAIQKVFRNHLTFIKGPPGCGKTRTVSRMVRLLAQNGLKVLVGSISNIANQSLISQIIKQVDQHNELCELYPRMKKIKVIINYSRIAVGKLSEDLARYSINNQLVQYILKINTSTFYHQNNVMEYIESLQKGQQVPNVFWSIYMKSMDNLIKDVTIVISTTINSFKLYNYTNFRPDVGVVDQAAQASWTDTYGFLAFGVSRMVFVGDEKQLAPTVIGDSNGNKILKQTMFQKLSQKNLNYFIHLKKQYRMHPQISQFPNTYIYEQKLINSQLAIKDRESQIDYFKIHTISFIHHKFEQKIYQSAENLDNTKGAKQYYNQMEISLIMDLLETIPVNELKNVGIITFYDMQYQILTGNLEEKIIKHGLTVKTIDGYQGGQKDYIIVSTVRSNAQYKPGFCIQQNRVNVALTRAKRGLIIFGDIQTLMQGKNINDEQQNIWGNYCKYMLRKNKLKGYEQFANIIAGIKIKQSSRQNLQLFYKNLSQYAKNWNSFKASTGEDQIFQNNKKSKKLANSLLNYYTRAQNIQQISLNQKLHEFFIDNDSNSQGLDLEQNNFSKASQIINHKLSHEISNKIQSQIKLILSTINNNLSTHQCFCSQTYKLIFLIHSRLQQQILNSEENVRSEVKSLIQKKQLKILSALKQTELLTKLIQSKLKFNFWSLIKLQFQENVKFQWLNYLEQLNQKIY